MKITLYIAAFSFFIIGCDAFNSAKPEVEDSMADSAALKEVVDSSILEQNITSEPEPEPEITTSSVADGVVSIDQVGEKYMIVIGSFENANLAKLHAEKFKNLGYETQVVAKNDGFHMVTAKSFDSFKLAKAGLPEFRKRIAHLSWVYINDSSFGK